MSDTTTQPASETAAEPEYIPQHVLSSEDSEPAAAPASEPPPPDPKEPAETPPEPAVKPAKTPEETRREAEDRRYRTLYAQRHAEKARADAAEAQRAALEERLARLENPGQQPPADLDKMVAERAERMVAEREYQTRFTNWDAAGIAEFGPAFRDSCATVGQMASDAQRQALVTVALDLDEAGPRAIVALANDPEQAERVLAMPVHKMALAMAKLGASTPVQPPPAVAALPPPIRPPAIGRSRGEPDPNGSMEDYEKWSSKVNWSNR